MFPELPMGPLTKKQWNKYKKATSVTSVTNHLHLEILRQEIIVITLASIEARAFIMQFEV